MVLILYRQFSRKCHPLRANNFRAHFCENDRPDTYYSFSTSRGLQNICHWVSIISFPSFEPIANIFQIFKRLALDRSFTAKVHDSSQSDNLKRAISNCHISMACIFVTAKIGYAGHPDERRGPPSLECCEVTNQH